MAEKIISKRVLFIRGRQRKFIDKVLTKISVKEAANLCHLSGRTIRDWRREKFLMDYETLKILARKVNLRIPTNIKLRDKYWYTGKGASAGGKAVWKKYGRIGGDPEHRKRKWREWWEKEGKYIKGRFITAPKPIKKPNFSKNLAEFVGIVLGDGGITQRQVTITLHSEDDKEYGKFVVNLIKRLFNAPVSINYDKKYLAVDLTVSRSELVRFCIQRLGLKKGNKIKQRVDIPIWIKRNRQYKIACVRGLIDTDGCVFIHRYKVNGKIYKYKKISFTSYSEPLRISVFRILRSLGMNPRLAQRKDVRLDSRKDVGRYFEIIGFHNPKYLKKIQK